jgi:hypothetical protein
MDRFLFLHWITLAQQVSIFNQVTQVVVAGPSGGSIESLLSIVNKTKELSFYKFNSVRTFTYLLHNLHLTLKMPVSCSVSE